MVHAIMLVPPIITERRNIREPALIVNTDGIEIYAPGLRPSSLKNFPLFFTEADGSTVGIDVGGTGGYLLEEKTGAAHRNEIVQIFHLPDRRTKALRSIV